jgi:hypothetical protein
MPAAPLERPAPQRPDGQPVTIAEALQDAPAPLAPAGAVAMKRWSAFAWLLVRGDAPGTALAPGGTLGGSQAGGFVRFRLGDGLSLGARASTALRPPRGAEIAVGLDWRPDRSIPINLLAERRQRLGAGGRSAFAITLYGGATRALPGRLRLDGYAQGGIVGLKSRDLFVDGSARLSAPLGPVEIALGGWGAAQPGAARLDAGPSLSYRLPVRGGNLRLQGDWRFRLAGDAVPGSGVALTLAADF